VAIQSLTIITLAWHENGCFDRWLEGSLDVAERIIIIDNSPGQHDSTRLYQPNARVQVVAPKVDDMACLADARNFSLDLVQSDYVMSLDSDEYVDKIAVPFLRMAMQNSDVDCWFARWNTYDGNRRLRISDYKLVMWRTSRQIRFTEACHESVTASARLARLRSGYVDYPIVHNPRPGKREHKRRQYLFALETVWNDQPCVRIQWFLANTYLQLGRRLEALRLSRVAGAPHEALHPVELVNLACLRSVLSDSHSESRLACAAARKALYQYKDDLEMIAFLRKPHARALVESRCDLLDEGQIFESCHCVDP
jgi:hypothetical protein